MDRRSLLQGIAATVLAGCVGPRLSSSTTAAAPDWELGWRSLTVDALEPVAARVQGRFPELLHGTLYRNGPARLERGGEPLSHWFLGDGMVQAFRIGPGGVTHHGRFVQTPLHRGERVRGNEAFNPANTSVLAAGGDLLALCEAGAAYRLDPRTLETRGPKEWAPELASMPFSAHPLPERDGSYWNFGLAPYASEQGLLLLYHFGADGRLLRWAHLPTPWPGYAHAFAQTERHLVLLLAPLVWDGARGITWFNAEAWQPSRGMAALLVDKTDLSRVTVRELPAGFVFHFGHAWEDGDRVRAYACWYEDAEFMHTDLATMKRGRAAGLKHARLAEVEIPLGEGRGRVTPTSHHAEFPVVDARFSQQRARVHFVTLETPDASRPQRGGIGRVDVESGRVGCFDYGPGVIPEEHLFVPSGAREGQGWLVGTSLDCVRAETRVAAFDAEHLEDGPVAMAVLPRALPLGVHGTFVKA